MVVLQRLFKQERAQARPSELESGNLPAEAAAPAEYAALSAAITPPWHIRHARMLIAAAGVLATVGLAYVSYQVWQIYTNPVDRIMAMRVQAARPAAPEPVSPAAPEPVSPAAPEPVSDVRASPPVAKPPPSPPRPSVSGTIPTTVTATVPSSSPLVPPVTHTVRDAARVGAASAAAPAAPAAPAVVDSGGCSEGVVALGLCTPGGKTAAK